MKKKDNYVLLIIILVILLSVCGILYFSDKDEDIESNLDIKYSLLNDYSTFFTVNSCVYKYITYLTSKDTASVINLLDNEYKVNNGINDSNLYNYIMPLDGAYNFKAKKIYQGKISDNYIQYLVYGYLIKDSLDGVVDKKDYYIIVNFDTTNHLFNVAPYDGKIFKEGNNG